MRAIYAIVAASLATSAASDCAQDVSSMVSFSEPFQTWSVVVPGVSGSGWSNPDVDAYTQILYQACEACIINACAYGWSEGTRLPTEFGTEYLFVESEHQNTLDAYDSTGFYVGAQVQFDMSTLPNPCQIFSYCETHLTATPPPPLGEWTYAQEFEAAFVADLSESYGVTFYAAFELAVVLILSSNRVDTQVILTGVDPDLVTVSGTRRVLFRLDAPDIKSFDAASKVLLANEDWRGALNEFGLYGDINSVSAVA
jgi:hypothetical protein